MFRMDNPQVERATVLIRPLVIMLMVTAHVPWTYYNAYKRGFELDLSSFLMKLFTGTFSSAAVPSLSAISGYFAYSSLRKAGYFPMLRKKVGTLLVPMLIWNAVMVPFIIWKQMGGYPMRLSLPLLEGELMPWITALTSIGGLPANQPLYFLKYIFMCFVFVKVFDFISRYNVLSIVALVTLFPVTIFLATFYPYNRFDIPVWFLAGYAFAALGWSRTVTFNKFSSSLTGLIFLALASIATMYALSGNAEYYRSVQKVVNLFAPITLFLLTISFVSGIFQRFLSRISKYSFSIFLCHTPATFVTGLLWARLTKTHISTSYLAGPLAVIAMIAMTAFVSFHIGRIAREWLSSRRQGALAGQGGEAS